MKSGSQRRICVQKEGAHNVHLRESVQLEDGRRI